MSNQAIIEFARVRFDRVDASLAEIDQQLTEFAGCVGRLELSAAALHVQVAECSVRLHRFSDDLERIKRRLGPTT